MNQYKVLTVTHHKVPVDQLAQFQVPADADGLIQRETLQELKQRFALDELMYLNTCNRVTFFFTTKESLSAGFATAFFKLINPSFNACNAVHANLFEGAEALAHICEVGASLDSLVVGEREIIRQLRLAYESSEQMDLTGDDLRLAMKYVIPAAKRIYTETSIAEHRISVVSLAANALQKANANTSARVLLIGAGETMTHFGQYLREMGYTQVTVFNRNMEKAEALAKTFHGNGNALDALQEYDKGFDILIACTGAQHLLVDRDLYAHLLQGDTDKKVIIDLSVPANVDREIEQHFPVHPIYMQSLEVLAARNKAKRKAEIHEAKKLAYAFVKEFQGAYVERMVERAHSVIPQHLHAIREKATKEVFAKDMAKMDAASRDTVERMMDYFEKKYMALTMSASKEAMKKGQAHTKHYEDPHRFEGQ
ncbi:MAG: hypothetical protein R2794_13500 [Chitinophagales bacterium]